jgi:hypothetical protein
MLFVFHSPTQPLYILFHINLHRYLDGWVNQLEHQVSYSQPCQHSR